MADLDYGKVTIYPGNYDDYMEASTQARERQANANAKAKERIAELQTFVRRFSANASKAKQATSRLEADRQDQAGGHQALVAPVPVDPLRVRREGENFPHRQAVELDGVSHAFAGGAALFAGFTATVDAGDRIAIIGENGVGKTTLLRAATAGDLTPSQGTLKWAEKAKPGYFAQDHAALFDADTPLTDWIAEYVRMGGYEGEDVETLIRGTLGRLLFSGDEVKKAVRVISGGEQGRMLFGSLMLMKPNVLLMDEPTNHLDMESIESLNTALEKFKGTLVFVSHDREFVSSLATRIWEIRDGRVIDYRGNYEEYLASQGVA